MKVHLQSFDRKIQLKDAVSDFPEKIMRNKWREL